MNKVFNRELLKANAKLWQHGLVNSTDELKENYLKQIDLLNQMKIAVAIEKSEKNFIIAEKLPNHVVNVYESDSRPYFESLFSKTDNVTIYETKSSKAKKENLKLLSEQG